MAMSLHNNLTIFLYGREAFWQFSSMAVSTKINLIHRHGLQVEIFPVKIIWDVFDNFPVWLWTFLTILLCGHDPTNLSAKSLTIFLCGFLTIFLSGFLTIFLSGFLTIFWFPFQKRGHQINLIKRCLYYPVVDIY